jgi:hypothetical protein
LKTLVDRKDPLLLAGLQGSGAKVFTHGVCFREHHVDDAATQCRAGHGESNVFFLFIGDDVCSVHNEEMRTRVQEDDLDAAHVATRESSIDEDRARSDLGFFDSFHVR